MGAPRAGDAGWEGEAPPAGGDRPLAANESVQKEGQSKAKVSGSLGNTERDWGGLGGRGRAAQTPSGRGWAGPELASPASPRGAGGARARRARAAGEGDNRPGPRTSRGSSGRLARPGRLPRPGRPGVPGSPRAQAAPPHRRDRATSLRL